MAENYIPGIQNVEPWMKIHEGIFVFYRIRNVKPIETVEKSGMIWQRLLGAFGLLCWVQLAWVTRAEVKKWELAEKLVQDSKSHSGTIFKIEGQFSFVSFVTVVLPCVAKREAVLSSETDKTAGDTVSLWAGRGCRLHILNQLDWQLESGGHTASFTL